MENKPREFWIEHRHEKDKPISKPYKKYVSSSIFGGMVGDEDYPECEIIHVIEYAAYEALLAIIKRQQDALEEIKTHGHSDLCITMKPIRENYICTYEIARATLAATKEELKKLGV